MPRTSPGLRSLPSISSATPNTIGTQMAALRIGKELMFSVVYFAFQRRTSGSTTNSSSSATPTIIVIA